MYLSIQKESEFPPISMAKLGDPNPALAIDKMPGPVCLCLKFSSPQIEKNMKKNGTRNRPLQGKKMKYHEENICGAKNVQKRGSFPTPFRLCHQKGSTSNHSSETRSPSGTFHHRWTFVAQKKLANDPYKQGRNKSF